MACGSWVAAKFNLWQRQTCGEIAEHGKSGRALDDCGETASDEVVEAGEIEVGQGAGISGGSSDAVEGAADQGDETVEHNERGKAAIDGAVAAGETGAAQGTLDDGEGGGGGMAASGTAAIGDDQGFSSKTVTIVDRPTNWGIMSPNQRKQWARRRK